MFSISFLPLLKIFANTPWLEKIPGISSTGNTYGTDPQGLSVARARRNPPSLCLVSPL